VGESIRQKVRDKHGIELRWEVRRIGHFVPGREVREFMDGEPFTGQV
jgi:UDP-N-acetylmuramate dehydrogenase